MNFTDEITLRIGGTSFKVRRLTIAEIRQARVDWQGGKECLDEEYERLVKSHVTLADGKPFDPSALSLPQMQKLVSELVGIPEGSGLTDFIGLLC